MKEKTNYINKRNFMILLIVLVIIALGLVAVYVFRYLDNRNDDYCRQFFYDDCPLDRCKIGSSCRVCEDIGCHSKDYNKYWPKE